MHVGYTRVENSFIDYFKESTEIYQGMKIIDQKLGGTTPLDVIVQFETFEEEEGEEEDLDEFELEEDFLRCLLFALPLVSSIVSVLFSNAQSCRFDE